MKKLTRILHGTLKQHAKTLEQLNRERAGVYITVNETDLGGRKAENVIALRALFVDSDDGPLVGTPPLAPNIITHSVAGDHLYWLLVSGEELARFTPAQMHLAATMGTDHRVKDLPRVMRVPGFFHNKGEPTIVTCEILDNATRYDIDTVLAAFPLPEDKRPPVAPQSTQAPRPTSTPTPSSSGRPSGLARARMYLRKVDPAIQGSGGDNHTFHVACRLVRGFALSDYEALDLLLEEFNPRCVPPWSTSELEQKLKSAHANGSEAYGHMLDENSASYVDRPRREEPDWSSAYDHATGEVYDVPPPSSGHAVATEYHASSGEKLKPIDMAHLMRQDFDIVRDPAGTVFLYRSNYWRPVTLDYLKARSMKYDSQEQTTDARRTEVAKALLAMAQEDEDIKWNALSPNEAPFQNGVLDVITGAMRPHRRSDYLDKLLPYDYQPDAESLLWRQLLTDWFSDDRDYIAKMQALQEFFGYVLLNHARYKKALVLYSPESNTGKSLAAHALRLMVGARNCCAIGVENMSDPRRLAPIRGKMLNIITEIDEDAVVADGGFKQLVSTEEPVQVDEKYMPEAMITPTAKHVFCTNNLPAIGDKTKAVYNRLLVIRFSRVFQESEQDPVLPEKLKVELPGIIRWAVDGARRLTEQLGIFTDIAESRAILDDYRAEANPMALFVEEFCHVWNDPETPLEEQPRVEFRKICDSFNGWNPTGRRWSPRAIGNALTSMGVHRMSVNGKRWVFGLSLRGDEAMSN